MIVWLRRLLCPRIGVAPPGWRLVPEEMTNEMHRACKRALYEHISKLPEFKQKPPRPKVGTCKMVDRRTKENLRWKAMLDAAPKYDGK